ncbi:MAG: FAD-binding oxidoreductase [Planctomycetes bacterium]|nr:FAD-binding oxidoreductase [Planctomycetota bacterium]
MVNKVFRLADHSSVLTAEAVIIGAGFAGAATAYHLTRRGLRDVVIVEQESLPGVHASGRNAAMVRQVNSDAGVAALAREGAAFIRELASQLEKKEPAGFFRQTGSLLVASGIKAAQLREDAEAARSAGVPVERWDRETATRQYPVLEGAKLELGCFCPSDGVVDIAYLLRWYLEAAQRAGARLILEAGVTEIASRRGRLEGLRAGKFEIHAPLLVNAAGAWAQAIAGLAGAADLPLRPRRRHLFVSGPLSWVPRDWPFIWDLSTGLYFRPESGGLLLSPCDESDPLPRYEASDVFPEAPEILKEKIERQFPALASLSIRTGWSGLRTLTPDGRFILGPDPRLEGFFWAAGLGGHGVTASYAIGRLAADLILDPSANRLNPHRPGRFGGEPAALPQKTS